MLAWGAHQSGMKGPSNQCPSHPAEEKCKKWKREEGREEHCSVLGTRKRRRNAYRVVATWFMFPRSGIIERKG